jgi:hypothetical protein
MSFFKPWAKGYVKSPTTTTQGNLESISVIYRATLIKYQNFTDIKNLNGRTYPYLAPKQH